MTIHMLDDELINKIAAGEVIERPASVVKELVENAIDAGSSRIRISIARGGQDSIAVADDGQGISGEEIALAFMRHATSKLAGEQDLFAIGTLGFRGEALPSIAAVARVEIRTACQDGHGQCAVIEGGRWLHSEPAALPRGTSIEVQDLFFNTPARKKFMKSAGSESGRISRLVTSLALGRPDIAFEYRNEKKLLFKTPGDGSLYNAMLALFGQDYCRQFMEINYQSEALGLQGYISKPEFKRLNRSSQYFYVNDRLVESPMLARSLDEGYRGRLVSREYPAAVVKIRISPEEVDVNIHPQKKDVKFQDDSMIFRALQSLIKSRLQTSGNDLRAAAGIYSAAEQDKPGSRVQEPGPIAGHYQTPAYKPAPVSFSALLPVEWRQEVNRQARHFLPPDREAEPGESCQPEPCFQVLCQLDRRYIVLQRGDALLLVDQHAAHERILFERLRHQSSGDIPGQDLLMPLHYDLGPGQYEFVMSNRQRFASLGLEIEAFGDHSVLLRTLPVHASKLDLDSLEGIIETMQNGREQDTRDEVLALLACKSAIKSGDYLNRESMERLVEELLSLENGFACPHGRPTIIKIDTSELDRRFKRIV